MLGVLAPTILNRRASRSFAPRDCAASWIHLNRTDSIAFVDEAHSGLRGRGELQSN
jgi:hypothetical protein